MKDQTLILEHAQVIDVETGTIEPATILIRHGVIVQIVKNTSAKNDQTHSHVKRIDLKGAFVLPGLIDMHVHIKELFAPLFTASGVTTVRNTGGNLTELEKMIHAPVNAPTPRVISTDRIIDGPPGLWGETGPWSINVDSEEVAKREVRRQVRAGADFIKVYGLLEKSIMEIVVKEAAVFGKEVSCDLLHSSTVHALDAAEMGVKWFEHASGIIQAMYPDWHMGSDQESWNKINWNEPEVSKINEVCEVLLQTDAIICPTLTLYDQQQRLGNRWAPDHTVIHQAFKNNSLINQWEHFSQFEAALRRIGMQTTLIKEISRVYASLGGRVVAGTDTPAGIWTFPGMALHRELELLVESGFSELEAIRSATIHAAHSIKRQDLGVIKEGAIADMIILNSNPLLDIKATQQINVVIKGGKVYTAEDLFKEVPSEEEAEKTFHQFLIQYENKKPHCSLTD
ncbi:amidohydrolase family protein [Alkalicoccobacillus murimartini]|uniref:Amidohydrolase n=1 Tax=Alkalicoccobacillus murimartini TaxID=171685 RepID=A0ABT9YGX7_9BACI|nr:amidohydrolase family protein [Alkalicoccobacillus murimartini]MDQ0206745.1 putative amidohydrolase [Alkalicoccobacillus murimartini]